MIDAFGIHPSIATRHESRIGVAMRRAAKAEGHRKGVPSKRAANQWDDNLTETERKTLQGRHKGWDHARIARCVGISQKRVAQIIEDRREYMDSIGRPWA